MSDIDDLWSRATRRLLLSHPLAWVVSAGEGDLRATPLPLRPVLGGGGAVTALHGHLPRASAHAAVLRRQPTAMVLFMGPQGYVSPSWLSDRTQAPTWNYAAVQFVVEVEFVDDDDFLEAQLRDLVAAMEQDRPAAWSIEEMGARYRQLAARIVGFRAKVVGARPSFKLGQAEPERQFAEILAGLGRDGRSDLADWMQAVREGGPG